MNNKDKSILIINTCDNLSTGNIAYSIGEYVSKELDANFVLFVKEKTRDKNVIGLKDSFFGKIISCLDGSDGLSGQIANTKKVCKYIEKNRPSVIHLHNVHGRYINIEKVIETAKKHDIPIIWTIHDQWLITNRCTSIVQCDKYLTGCKKCHDLKKYPKSIFDNHGKNLIKKEQVLSNNNIHFVSPSLAFCKQFKEKYDSINIQTINNGIDISSFDYNEDYYSNNKNNKTVILCVASKWSHLKGIDIITKLSNKLNDNYIIKVVGEVDDSIKQSSNKNAQFFKSMNKNELAKMYNSSDIFLIPSRLDNYPTVIMEASCCGLPTIGFNVGGVPELIDKHNGEVLNIESQDTVSDLINSIKRIQVLKNDRKQFSIRSKEKYNQNNMYEKYLKLYKDILNK